MSKTEWGIVGALVILILAFAGMLFGGGGRMTNGLVADGTVTASSTSQTTYRVDQSRQAGVDEIVWSWPGFGTVEQCGPTRSNPRYKCVPAGLNGTGNPAVNICQLGGCLPNEWKGLPALGGSR